MGTESNGGFKNITISNCVFEYCRGLALETIDVASVEDVTITNITMRDVTNSPLFLRLGARLRGPQGTVAGVLRRINISNLRVYNADAHFASIISGLPGHPVGDVNLNNIHIYYCPLDFPQNRIQPSVPEFEADYPEPAKFGVLPVYGLFVRHASKLSIKDVKFHLMGAESRPAFYAEDVNHLQLREFEVQKSSSNSNYILKNVSGFLMFNAGDKKAKRIANTSYTGW